VRSVQEFCGWARQQTQVKGGNHHDPGAAGDGESNYGSLAKQIGGGAAFFGRAQTCRFVTHLEARA